MLIETLECEEKAYQVYDYHTTVNPERVHNLNMINMTVKAKYPRYMKEMMNN